MIILYYNIKEIQEVTNNLFVFLIAGFDTTYTAMNNCFHTLTAHTDEMKKLQDEIDSVLNDVKSNKIFYVDYKNIFYLFIINFI